MTLDSVWAKIGRAEEHADTIENEIAAWSNSDPYRILRQRNADATRYSITVKVHVEPPLERWALVTGDCVHNLRAALDHTTYCLAIGETKSDPPADERRLAFPIADTPDAFTESRWRIKVLSEKVQAEIERLQPYHRPHDELPPLLALLRDLDDADKHRLLQVSFSQPLRTTFRNVRGTTPGQRVEGFVHQGAVDDGTEIATFTFDRPTPDLQFEFSTDLAIVVRHAPGPKRATMTGLRPLLRLLTGEVRAVIGALIAVSTCQGHPLPPSSE